MGLIFDIKHYAIHDGPGIRTTIFFKGCPLDCPWCHNPESKKAQAEFMWSPDKCIGCRKCVDSCRENAILFSEILKIDESKCNLCGNCVKSCYSGALELVGRDMSVNEVMAEINKDQIFHIESGGGVTFSGGEPLSQPEFLKQLLVECQKKGIHTAVDTSGYTNYRNVESVKDLVDLWLYDLKHMDPTKHIETIGVSNKQILKNLEKIKNQKVIIRYPLIPGFNDNISNIKATGKYLHENGFTDISLLPYHKVGSEKIKRLNIKHPFSQFEPPSDIAIKQVADILSTYNLDVKIGG